MTIQHGGDILAVARELACRPEEILDMSGNLSPLGQVEGLKEALQTALGEIGFLPENGSAGLCLAFASRYGLSPEEVAAGNGSTEFIYAVPAALAPARAVVVQPGYGDYRLAADWAGIPAFDFCLRPENDFFLDLEKLEKSLHPGDLVFLCNPNNPTARTVASAALHDLARNRPDVDFLVDEAYLPFVAEPSLLRLPLLKNLLILISFSKPCNIPGLRLGILVAAKIKQRLLRLKTKPWGVNRLAQQAGVFLLDHADSAIGRLATFVADERPRLARGLAAFPGIRVFPGEANFILCRLAAGPNAGQLRAGLLKKKILIRDCANFSCLDNSYFRVNLKKPAENDRFLAALAEVLGA